VEPDIRGVIERVCVAYGVTEVDLMGAGRTHRTIEARGVAYYVLRKYRGQYLREIAVLFKRDHSTVAKVLAHVAKRLAEDDTLRVAIMEIADAPMADSLAGMKRLLDIELEHARAVVARLESMSTRLELQMGTKPRRTLVA
jgi:hypothetical protein